MKIKKQKPWQCKKCKHCKLYLRKFKQGWCYKCYHMKKDEHIETLKMIGVL